MEVVRQTSPDQGASLITKYWYNRTKPKQIKMDRINHEAAAPYPNGPGPASGQDVLQCFPVLLAMLFRGEKRPEFLGLDPRPVPGGGGGKRGESGKEGGKE